MLAAAMARSNGNTKRRLVQEEADEWKKAEKDIDMNYTLHRPIGRITIAVSEGENIRSRDLGLSGNVGCRVYWDPLRFAKDKQKARIIAIDKSATTSHEIGWTDSVFTTNPVWTTFIESDECRRLKQVSPHNGHFFETEEEIAMEGGVEFPVLQPFRKLDDGNETVGEMSSVALDHWKASPAAVVVEVRFHDILNMLPGSDHVFGEVVIPLCTLVEKGEISGWFRINPVGTNQCAQVELDSNEYAPELDEGSSFVGGTAETGLSMFSECPKLWVGLKWIPPNENLSSLEARETDREASAVIQEEFLRWAVINRDKDKLKKLVVGGSIGAFKTVSGLAGTLSVIQNFLGHLANALEAVRNLLNFTVSPSRLLVVPTESTLVHLRRTELSLHLLSLSPFLLLGSVQVVDAAGSCNAPLASSVALANPINYSHSWIGALF